MGPRRAGEQARERGQGRPGAGASPRRRCCQRHLRDFERDKKQKKKKKKKEELLKKEGLLAKDLREKRSPTFEQPRCLRRVSLRLEANERAFEQIEPRVSVSWETSESEKIRALCSEADCRVRPRRQCRGNDQKARFADTETRRRQRAAKEKPRDSEEEAGREECSTKLVSRRAKFRVSDCSMKLSLLTNRSRSETGFR